MAGNQAGGRTRQTPHAGVRKNPLYAEACSLGLHCVDTGAEVALRDGETGADLADNPDDAKAFAARDAGAL